MVTCWASKLFIYWPGLNLIQLMFTYQRWLLCGWHSTVLRLETHLGSVCSSHSPQSTGRWRLLAVEWPAHSVWPGFLWSHCLAWLDTPRRPSHTQTEPRAAGAKALGTPSMQMPAAGHCPWEREECISSVIEVRRIVNCRETWKEDRSINLFIHPVHPSIF